MKGKDSNLPLSNLPVGQFGQVIYLDDNDLKRRFLDLGITPHTVIKTERLNPAGNPIAYNIRGTIIAIRKEEAKNILVKIL
ncbi:ferrous iron transport protein A [Tissierella sp. MSJ-40]|uniref:Ferrous iron transport protein A n=1 Tax=Tissierella simiarum TaxID=2841534 RepID=A0ABS6E6J8_9FIRM|nr:FeoA family protein [Tissierella simiarum]MBU5438558.1 ferrous iron transport protein A [Tissierella simiarum]